MSARAENVPWPNDSIERLSKGKELPYGALNHPVLAQVPKTTRRLLDVGCGTGTLGYTVKQELDCYVVGITHSQSEAVRARASIDEVILSDLNSLKLPQMDRFDCVICSHVLEHLMQPVDILKRLRDLLTSHGLLIVALPNVLFWRQRLSFLRGNFKYTQGGLMDHTHFRFFDWMTAHELLAESGYIIVEAKAHGSFPLSKSLHRAGQYLDRAALRAFPGLFGFQFVFVCRQAST